MDNKSKKPIKLLNRNFILLWQGQLVSLFGDNFYYIAMLFWIKQVTGSASLMGLIGMFSLLPGIILGPILGVFADHYSRKKILIFSDLIRGVLVIALTLFVFLNPDAKDILVYILFAVGILLSICGSIFNPAISASIPNLVPHERLHAANSMNRTSITIAQSISLGIGGLLFRIVGMPFLFLINGISYIYSGISEMVIQIPQEFSGNRNNVSDKFSKFLNDFKEGLQFLLDNRGFLYLLIVFANSNFFIMGSITLLPIYVENFLEAATDWYGYLLGGISLGSLIGFIIISIKMTDRIRGYFFITTFLLHPILWIGLGFIADKEVALIIMILWGLIVGIQNVCFMTICQQRTPDRLRGRVLSVMALSFGIAPIGMGISGIAADLLNQNIPLILIIGGLINILVRWSFISISPLFRNFLLFKTS